MSETSSKSAILLIVSFAIIIVLVDLFANWIAYDDPWCAFVKCVKVK